MAENNTFNQTVESLFKGMDSFITTKTVVGDGDPYWRYDHSAAGGCLFRCCGRGAHAGEEKQRSRRNGRKDHTERGFGDPEWNHKVGEYQKSGWHHKSA